MAFLHSVPLCWVTALLIAGVFVLLPLTVECKEEFAPFNRLGSLWPKSRVYYKIDSSYPKATKAIILQAMQNIESKTCVKFIEAQSSDRFYVFIRKGSPGDGCKAGIGFDGRPRQLVDLEPSCFKAYGRILKVLLHVLGVPEENNRNDRDEYIKVHDNNVNDSDDQNHFWIRGFYDAIQVPLLDLPFDYDSVTMDDPYYLALNPTKPTLTAIKKLPRNIVLGQRTHMSTGDVDKVNLLYCNKDSIVHILDPPTEKCLNCNANCSGLTLPCCPGFYCFYNRKGDSITQSCRSIYGVGYCGAEGAPASIYALPPAGEHDGKECLERCSKDSDCRQIGFLSCQDLGAPWGKVCYGKMGTDCTSDVACCTGRCSFENKTLHQILGGAGTCTKPEYPILTRLG